MKHEFICTNSECSRSQICETFKRKYKDDRKFIKFDGKPDCEWFEDLKYRHKPND